MDAFTIPQRTTAPAGRYILSSSLDGKIRLWDFEKGHAVKFYQVRIPCQDHLGRHSVIQLCVLSMPPCSDSC